MASAVQHSLLLSPLPGLGSLKGTNNNLDACGETSVNEVILGAQTPTSSADPSSERTDPVALLSRPVEGFNFPRQHLFTDRLVGRFYEDSSLDAETRKTSKCLAGRLGTTGSNGTTRPSTTATPASHTRSSHSPTTTRRGGKRMQGSASARAVGREPGRVGLAGRKEQVQKEIQEQKALIEKLEGRVASLSGRGGRHAALRRSSALSREDRERDSFHARKGTGDRPATMPEPGRVETEQGEYKLRPNNHTCESGRGRTGSRSRRRSLSNSSEMADHGPNARRKSLHRPGEDCSAIAIQRNVRGSGKRKKFLALQSAREDLERHLQRLLSAASTALAQQKDDAGNGIGFGSRVKSVSSAALRLLETSREDGLAKPPFEILQAMYRDLDDVTAALGVLSSMRIEEYTAGTGAGARRSSTSSRGVSCVVSMEEPCWAVKEALETIREAVGASIQAIRGSRAATCGESAAPSLVAPRHHQDSPVGSGRAAAVAMASGRGGLLAPPDDSPASYRTQQVVAPSSKGEGVKAVPLGTLDVKGVARLLRAHNFEEYASGFIAQSVDGVMLSDPNLCEADFAELGLGGGGEGAHDSRAQMVSFFRRCQKSGIAFPDAEGLPPPSECDRSGPSGPHTDEVTPGKRRDGASSSRRSKLAPSEESRWRRGSALVNRQNQHVLTEITLNPGPPDGVAAGATDGRRISLRLNRGIVLTAGGEEVCLIDKTDGFSPRVAQGEAVASTAGGYEKGGVSTATPDGGGLPKNDFPRRTSVGLPAVTLCKESSHTGDGGCVEIQQDPPLPPDVAISAADTTVDVFR